MTESEIKKIVDGADADGAEKTDVKKTRKKREKKNPVKNTPSKPQTKNAIAEQLTTIYNTYSLFRQSIKKFEASDFSAESEEIKVITETWEIVGKIFNILTPVLLVIQLFSKWLEVEKGVNKYPVSAVTFNEGDIIDT